MESLTRQRPPWLIWAPPLNTSLPNTGGCAWVKIKFDNFMTAPVSYFTRPFLTKDVIKKRFNILPI